MFIKKGRVISVEDFIETNKEAIEQYKEPTENPITIEEAKKENRFYLPKLNLNSPDLWPSKPLEERRHFTDEVAMETCLGNCCGIKGLKSGCCSLDPESLEHILGPVGESEIKRLIDHFQRKGWNIRRSDFIIDEEEGKIIGRTFFNNHKVFEMSTSYPMLRFKINGPRFNCFFINNDSGKCTIHAIKPDFCRSYLCNFVKSNFLVRTKNKPNTWQKLQ